VAEVAFSTWTADHLLRHPSFEGLREDKPAGKVKLEQPRDSTPFDRFTKLDS
jgi:bifunctional non-homologous end joining protein LigD